MCVKLCIPSTKEKIDNTTLQLFHFVLGMCINDEDHGTGCKREKVAFLNVQSCWDV